MDHTELFIEPESRIQVYCTEDTRNNFQRIAIGTTIFQTDGDSGQYTYDGTKWVKHSSPEPEPIFTDSDIANIKKIPELCTLNDVVQYITDHKDVFETMSSLNAKIDSKSDIAEVYTKPEIDRKLLALSNTPSTALKTSAGSISVRAAKPPFANQVLTAINKEQAVWTDPVVPVTYVMYLQIVARLDELERYQRENEAKKRVASKPKTVSNPQNRIIFK